MVTKFTKGGILNTTQLQNLSGKKWKKGGILSADQLNELVNNEENKAQIIPIKIINNSEEVYSVNYLEFIENTIVAKTVYSTGGETTINACAFNNKNKTSLRIPYGANLPLKNISYNSALGKTIGPLGYTDGDPSHVWPHSLLYNSATVPNDELITITIS